MFNPEERKKILKCIMGHDGSRHEFDEQDYQTAKQEAEAILPNHPDLVMEKTMQLLGMKISRSDEINLKAAEKFPNDNRLFALMIRHLSSDMPGAQLSKTEQAELEIALKNI